jgi:hypothetical protein
MIASFEESIYIWNICSDYDHRTTRAYDLKFK